MNGHFRWILRRTGLVYILAGGGSLLIACSVAGSKSTALPPTYVEVPYSDLALIELDPDILAEPKMPGCNLSDLPPFHWKEVNTGIVDIRTSEDYTIQTESLYREGFLSYQYEREVDPVIGQSYPELSYEEFLSICNVFPEVDFSRYSLLGYHASGKGCEVSFARHVYRNDQNRKVFYVLRVLEKGGCDQVIYDRNLILVPNIPINFSVVFSIEHNNE